MQFSTNSNAALLHEIRSSPTLAGQFRRAYLQLRDRQGAIANYRLERQKTIYRLELKKAEISKLEGQHHLHGSDADADIQAAQIGILTMEAEQLKLDLTQSDELLQDAAREAAVCQSECDRIVETLGVDPSTLSVEGYQRLMSQGFDQKLIRYFAAHVFGPLLGIQPEAAEQLLEMDEAQQTHVMQSAAMMISRVPLPEVASQREISGGEDVNAY